MLILLSNQMQKLLTHSQVNSQVQMEKLVVTKVNQIIQVDQENLVVHSDNDIHLQTEY